MSEFNQLCENLDNAIFDVLTIKPSGNLAKGSGTKEYSFRKWATRKIKKAEKTREERRSKASKFVRDENHNTKGEFHADCSPERRKAVERLRAAYDLCEGNEVSPFGEYEETEGFFEHENDVVEISPVIVEVNGVKFAQNATNFLSRFPK